MSHWSAIGWVCAGYVGFHVFAALVLNGKPRTDPTYSAVNLCFEALLLWVLFYFAGAWS